MEKKTKLFRATSESHRRLRFGQQALNPRRLDAKTSPLPNEETKGQEIL